jgi:large subunit ribosomal protein L19
VKVTIDSVEQSHLKKNLPSFRVGDQVRATLKIVEGDNERLQAFEGTVIRLRGHGLSRMFTLRKISFGVGVERSIPLHSPRIEKIEVLRSGHVRRARLYFLRARTGKAARLDEKIDRRDVGSPDSPPSAPAKTPAPAHVAGPARPSGHGRPPKKTAPTETFQIRSVLSGALPLHRRCG